MLNPKHFWRDRLEEAHSYMRRLAAYPLVECGEPLGDLEKAAAEAGVEIIFPGGLKKGLFRRQFFLRKGLIVPLLKAAEAFLCADCVLKIEDACRTLDIQAQGAGSDFFLDLVLEKVRWELDGALPDPELFARRVMVLTATTPKFANHVSGSALDITICHRNGGELDRGAPYLEISEKTPMDSPFISAAAQANRRWINEVFAEFGFLPYPYEFWHYSSGDCDAELIAGSGDPGRYGPIHVEDGTVLPITDCHRSLLSPDRVRDFLERVAREE